MDEIPKEGALLMNALLKCLFIETVKERGNFGMLSGKSRGRFQAHLDRLTEKGRTQAEKNLAAVLSRTYSNLGGLGDSDEVRRARMLINGESIDTCMFWTLSPYILEFLTTSGHLNDKQAVEKLTKWAATGDGEDGTNKLSLRGLQELNPLLEKLSKKTFVLSRDHSDVTHEAARQIGHYIAQNID